MEKLKQTSNNKQISSEVNTKNISSHKHETIELVKSVIGAYEFILPKRYITKDLIGYGSFGAVVEAVDSKYQRLVAIKKIQSLSDQVDVKRVIREIIILKNLKHDNIITLFDVIYIKE